MPLHHHVSYICLQINQTKQTLLQVDFKMHTHWMTIPISHIFMIQIFLTCGTKITKFFKCCLSNNKSEVYYAGYIVFGLFPNYW